MNYQGNGMPTIIVTFLLICCLDICELPVHMHKTVFLSVYVYFGAVGPLGDADLV